MRRERRRRRKHLDGIQDESAERKEEKKLGTDLGK